MTYPEITNCETCPLKDLCIEKEYFVTCVYMKAKAKLENEKRHRNIMKLCWFLMYVCGLIMYEYTINDMYYFIFGYSVSMGGDLVTMILFMIIYALIIFPSLYYVILNLGGEWH
jgi:hypothetical protein